MRWAARLCSGSEEISSQFSVLSSQFSVLSSQFSDSSLHLFDSSKNLPITPLLLLPLIGRVVEFLVPPYEPKNSYRDSGRYRRRGTEIYPDAGAPSVVRSGLAGRVGPVRGQNLRRGRALAAEDTNSSRSGGDESLSGHTGGRTEDYFCRP